MVAVKMDRDAVRSVVSAALWGLFAGDALSSPTHWCYGGAPQIKQLYGSLLTDYTKPVFYLPGSILNKSNLSGGGRSSNRPSSLSNPTIIGNVINHGKADLWSPKQSIHYHATLEKGENTLEAQLVRVWMKTIAQSGLNNKEAFSTAYMKFMTTKDSHNDTYASTCHRMFFANRVYKKLPPEQCPDNDKHNVDTMDGLVLPTVAALAVAAREGGTVQEAALRASEAASVTRKSDVLERYAAAWGSLVYKVVRNEQSMSEAATECAKELGLRAPKIRRSDEMSACYLQTSMPSMLDSLVKYESTPVWDALLANANLGGENVHRGACLGSVLGANQPNLDAHLKEGLYLSSEIQDEIASFVDAVCGKMKERSEL